MKRRRPSRRRRVRGIAAPISAEKGQRTRPGHPRSLRKAQLDLLIEEATTDAYNESEQRVGFQTMMSDHIRLPFETMVLGLPVVVERIDLTDAEEIGAYRRWTRGR